MDQTAAGVLPPPGQPGTLTFGEADVLAAMAMTALLAGLCLGAVIGLAYLAAKTVTFAASAIAEAVLPTVRLQAGQTTA